MFDILKKKVSGFINSIVKKEEKKPEEPVEREIEEKLPEVLPPKPETKEKPPAAPPRPKIEEKPAPPPKVEIPEKKPEIIPEKKPEVKPEKEPEKRVLPEEKPAPPPGVPPKQEAVPKPVKKERPAEKKKEKVRLSAVTAVKSFLTGEVEIKEADIKELLDDFELGLLESDVDIDVAAAIIENIRSKLINSKVKKSELNSFIKNQMKDTLVSVLGEGGFSLVEKVRQIERPVKIVFLGVNGAGKTTTIAKVAQLLMTHGHTVVFAASDTFRAAAIEQIEVHAGRLGVHVIKRAYGSDPTSVAFDAVNYAKAHGIDAVLIDTAGRQDTNINLINELKKMVRVIKPDLKIYVGESLAGNAILDQIESFNSEIGIDGIILTKLDCDAKGGTMLSIRKRTGVPLIYVGTGQKYSDIEVFVPEKIIERILS